MDLSHSLGVRANIHLGGQAEFCPNGFSGGGVVGEIRILWGGRIFSVNCSNRPSIRVFFR